MYRSVSALLALGTWLSSNRAWKNRPRGRGGDVHRTSTAVVGHCRCSAGTVGACGNYVEAVELVESAGEFGTESKAIV